MVDRKSSPIGRELGDSAPRPRRSSDGHRSRRSRSSAGGRSLNGNSRRSTGYTLQRRSMNYGQRSGVADQVRSRGLMPIIAGVVALAVIGLLIFGISSCVRGCSNQAETQQQATVGSASGDSRVNASASEALVKKLEPALNRADAIQWIAKNTDRYPSEKIVQLAVDEPDAIDFVRAYPDADKSARAYGSDSIDSIPSVYNWDERWGNVDYNGLPLAVSGSGPTCLSMAYMGLNSKTDKTPADMAALATNVGGVGGEAGTQGAFFTSVAGDLGLSINKLEDLSNDSIVGSITNTSPVLCQIKGSTFGHGPHWVLLIAGDAADNVTVYDPTCVEVTTRTWPIATITSSCAEAYLVYKAG